MAWLPMAGSGVPFHRRLLVKVAVPGHRWLNWVLLEFGPTLSRLDEQVGDIRGLMRSSHLDSTHGHSQPPGQGRQRACRSPRTFPALHLHGEEEGEDGEGGGREFTIVSWQCWVSLSGTGILNGFHR